MTIITGKKGNIKNIRLTKKKNLKHKLKARETKKKTRNAKKTLDTKKAVQEHKEKIDKQCGLPGRVVGQHSGPAARGARVRTPGGTTPAPSFLPPAPAPVVATVPEVRPSSLWGRQGTLWGTDG